MTDHISLSQGPATLRWEVSTLGWDFIDSLLLVQLQKVKLQWGFLMEFYCSHLQKLPLPS